MSQDVHTNLNVWLCLISLCWMVAATTKSLVCDPCNWLCSQVCKDPALDNWQLYLVDWGYNTQKERARAAANPRIKVINSQQFAELLGV